MKNRLIIFCLICLLFAGAFTVFLSGDVKANTITEYYTISCGQYDKYTDSLYYYDSATDTEDTQKVLTDYNDYFYNESERFFPNQDEWIAGFVPKEFFIDFCSVFYIGKTYGFFVNHNDNGVFVALFLTCINVNNGTDGNVSIKIMPLCIREYWYNNNTDQICPETYFDEVFGGAYFFPEDINRSFHMKDISVAADLQNLTYSNKGDNDYTGDEDNGAFFINNKYTYSGTTKRSQQKCKKML